MNGNSMHGQVIDFRELTKEQQRKTLKNYTSRLSKYSEIYTLTSEIEDAIANDKNFYILVFLIDNIPVAHIQFKYFEESKMIFVDSIYTLKNDVSYANTLYYVIEEKVSKMFDVASIVTEVSFSNKRRNRALEKLLALQDFKSLNFNYLQPPTESLYPTIGRLLVKQYKKDFTIENIIKDIYFNHYAFWYRRKRFYKFRIICLYLVQKILIKV